MSSIAIIGSGIVGQATGKGFMSKGHHVVFCDINEATLEKLREEGFETCPVEHMEFLEADTFLFTVSTPTEHGHIDLHPLKGAARTFAEKVLSRRKQYCLAVFRSTAPPGTVEDVLIPVLEKYSGKKAGGDFGVCMNPEYLRERTSEQDFLHPWIIVIGELDDQSGKYFEHLCRPAPARCPIIHVSLKEAEMCKYVHNIFNACKVSFFNEMRVVCEDIGVDADTVFEIVGESAQASWDRNYGLKNLGPFDGSCLPKDTSAFLYWSHHALHHPLPLLQAVIQVNEDMKKRKKLRRGLGLLLSPVKGMFTKWNKTHLP